MEKKKIAISQSNYIPWKGYFDLIASVDEFVFYDDMQYTKRDWRNRNQIKTPNGLKWLSVPVEVKGKYFQKINETKISDAKWGQSHWTTLTQSYKKSEFFEEVAVWLKPLYLDHEFEYLSDLNHSLVKEICNYLGIKTPLLKSSDFELVEGKTERLLGICLDRGATHYVSGPAAKDYMNLELFESRGVEVGWFDYNGYPEYDQLWGDFSHNVSILDLIFQNGPKSPEMMKFTGFQ